MRSAVARMAAGDRSGVSLTSGLVLRSRLSGMRTSVVPSVPDEIEVTGLGVCVPVLQSGPTERPGLVGVSVDHTGRATAQPVQDGCELGAGPCGREDKRQGKHAGRPHSERPRRPRSDFSKGLADIVVLVVVRLLGRVPFLVRG